jgi:hypothetical protein
MYWEYNVIICIFLKASLQESLGLVFVIVLITGNLNIQAVKDNNPISLLKKHYPYAFPPMQTVPVTEGEIRINYIPITLCSWEPNKKIPTNILWWYQRYKSK